MSTTDPKTGKPPDPDDALRLMAAARLAKYLDRGDEFLEECKKLARESDGSDRLGPLAAAARLMNSNARIAQVLAQVARVERRSRTVVERIAPPDTRKAELISEKMSQKQAAEAKVKVARRMEELVQQSIRVRMGEATGEDRVAHLVKHYGENLERIRRELNDLGAEDERQ